MVSGGSLRGQVVAVTGSSSGIGAATARAFAAEGASVLVNSARSVAEGEAAIADDHNNAEAHADTGFWKMYVGRTADGVADIETALRLSPRDPMVPYWRSCMCRLHSHLARWEKAIEWCNMAAASGFRDLPHIARHIDVLASLAAAHAWAETEHAAIAKLTPPGVAGATTELDQAPAPLEPSTAEVRAWARAIGLTVPDRGKLRPDIWDAWRTAHAE